MTCDGTEQHLVQQVTGVKSAPGEEDAQQVMRLGPISAGMFHQSVVLNHGEALDDQEESGGKDELYLLIGNLKNSNNMTPGS